MRRKELEAWLDKYKKSWELQDSEAFVDLFTPDARYRETPFVEFVEGSDFRPFWDEIASKQADNRFHYEIILISGDRAVVHWTCTSTWLPADERRMGDGIFLLAFSSDGRCKELLEWAHWQLDGLAPRKVWGALADVL